MKYISFSLVLSTFLFSQELSSFPSYQGFKGVINTPNSSIMTSGDFEFLYTNQVENLHPSNIIDFRDNKTQRNFFLNIGVIPNLDINFKYANGNDPTKLYSHEGNNIQNHEFLSNRVVNLKYKIPFIPHNFFQVAIGGEDIAGGNTYKGSKYIVTSKELGSLRSSIGYAQGESEGSLDGIFGSIEYQPLAWLQLAGEYDTKEWNGAIKAQYRTDIIKRYPLNLGLMAKSSLDYSDVYLGAYINIPFEDCAKPIKKQLHTLPSHLRIEDLKLANTRYVKEKEKLYFEYENNLYVYNDIDTLGVVLGILTTTTDAKNIEVAIKRTNIIQYIVKVNREEYQEFLKNGTYRSNLLQFVKKSTNKHIALKNSDRFKPTLTLSPDFVLIDGSEYSDVWDYTVAMRAELSIRLAQGTIVSGRYNIPLTQSINFEEDRIYAYRNRNKTSTELDQLLLSQYLTLGETYPWTSLVQVGLFDNEMKGVSFESAISDSSGKHQLLLKVAQMDDDLSDMDRYTDDKRDERLLSYRYYLGSFNANIKLTTGEFLYGDKGEAITFERFFNDVSFKFDLSHTTHNRKGDTDFFRFTLSVPFGPNKRIKSDYLDIKGDKLVYKKIKNIVSHTASYSLPHHFKEVDNSFTLEKYYLNNNHFHPAYIKSNHNRLRNVFLGI